MRGRLDGRKWVLVEFTPHVGEEKIERRPVITIDDQRIKSHLDRVVRGTVEETLNALLDAEADRLCNAQRYERSAARRDTRAGHYERGLQTKAGEVRLRVPKLRRQTFETAIKEWHCDL